MIQKITVGGLLVICLALTSVLFPAEENDLFKARVSSNDLYGPMDKEYYLTPKQIAFIRPGLVLELRGLTIPEDLRPVVEFSLQDPAGLPLDIEGVFTPGPVSVTFIISRIPEGETQHVNYNTRTRTGPDGPVTQADRDRNGVITQLEPGVYTYQFNDALPDDLDRNAPHTIGVYARRDLREFELDRYVENAFIHFLPTEGDLTLLDAPPRDIVVTEACNQCHNPLGYHGGSRREVALCIQCHTPQTVSATTGEDVDFKVIIHRIHRGADLPSVEAGMPNLIGRDDYSEIVFPQDIRNCEKCHLPGPDQGVTSKSIADAGARGAPGILGGTQSMAWLMRPSRSVCGSCHDDVNFASGENHVGGPQISDNLCANCHFPEGELEYSSDIRGAHTVPHKSRQLAGINIEILDVNGTNPGENPTVYFTVRDGAGNTLDPASFNRFRFNLAGPSTDYAGQVRESGPLSESVPFQDGFTYTFEATVPMDATGTYAIGHESRRDAVLNPGTTEEFAIRESSGDNALYFFGVTDTEPLTRRMVVAQEKCNNCHDRLSFHGGQRHAVQYCVTCHNANAFDEEGFQQGIHFKYMIHRIHTGHELNREFTIEDTSFNELHFPGDLRDCETCHVNNSHVIANENGQFPQLPGLLATMSPADLFSPLPPVTAACVGCHDSVATAAHAYTQIAPFGEGCGACHGTGAEFAVERVHAR